MIYDCFTFFDELDLLELRLRTLENVVDRFVLCEAPFTFRGKPKPLHFSQARERFARWTDRITALVYPGPVRDDPWENEWSQRDYLAMGLSACAPDDLVMLSDCDEIPEPRNVAIRPGEKRVLGHRHRYSVGYVNRIAGSPWVGTRSILWRNLAYYRTLRTLRMLPNNDIDLVDGGWHFSHLGGTAAIENKMKSYAHSEYDLPYYTDRKRIEIEFASDLEVSYIPIDESFPQPIRDGQYGEFVWRGPEITDAALSRALQHANGIYAYVPADAAAVVGISAQTDLWDRVGRERFGGRFIGARPNLTQADSPPPGTWIVVDGFEQADRRTRAALERQDCGAVAYLRNARSFPRFDDLLGGKPLGAGRALGLAELQSWGDRSGRTFAATHRLQTPNIFAPWTHMPPTVGNVRLGNWLSFLQIERHVLADFLAQAFIVTSPPQAP